jgi:hypothetical protein
LNLLVTTAAKKFILSKGGKATAKLEGKKAEGPQDYSQPSVRLGQPEESEKEDFQEVDIGNNIKLYVHISLLNLDDTYNPKIDVEWKIFGRGLVMKDL